MDLEVKLTNDLGGLNKIWMCSVIITHQHQVSSGSTSSFCRARHSPEVTKQSTEQPQTTRQKTSGYLNIIGVLRIVISSHISLNVECNFYLCRYREQFEAGKNLSMLLWSWSLHFCGRQFSVTCLASHVSYLAQLRLMLCYFVSEVVIIIKQCWSNSSFTPSNIINVISLYLESRVLNTYVITQYGCVPWKRGFQYFVSIILLALETTAASATLKDKLRSLKVLALDFQG